MRRILGILILIGCSAVGARWLWLHRSIKLGPEELKVCEAVFRYQIEALEKAIPGQISKHYLSVKNIDPPNELLVRLRADKINAQAGSFFQHNNGAWHSVIRGFERLNDKTFLVHGGYENDGLSAYGGNYTVVYRDGRWVVDKEVGIWAA